MYLRIVYGPQKKDRTDINGTSKNAQAARALSDVVVPVEAELQQQSAALLEQQQQPLCAAILPGRRLPVTH